MRKGKRYKLVVFDIDGTITEHVSSWRYIHERLGLWDALAFKYQEQFLNGQINYEEFCRLDAAHWKGLKISKLKEIFKDIKYSKNVKASIRKLKERGFKLAAISTGLQFITQRVKDELRLDYVIGNRLLDKKGVLTGLVNIRIGYLEKGKTLKTIAKHFRLKTKEVVCVGDSDGDIPMFKIAGYSIAFNSSSPNLNSNVDYACKTKDFSEVYRKIMEVSGV